MSFSCHIKVMVLCSFQRGMLELGIPTWVHGYKYQSIGNFNIQNINSKYANEQLMVAL